MSSSISYSTTYAGEFFKLSTDLDMNSKGFTPIGNSLTVTFKGTFDGDNHSIVNLSLVSTGYGPIFCALFGSVTGANICNLNVDVVNFTGGKWGMDTVYMGGVIGYNYASNGTIFNVHVTLPETINAVAGGLIFGGIAGEFGGTITDCTVTGGVVETRNAYFGGIVGQCTRGFLIRNCRSNVSIKASAKSNQLGGIVGSATSGTISNCLYDGDISLILTADSVYQQYVGGIVGHIESGAQLYYCLFQGSITYQHCGSDSSNKGSIAGFANCDTYDLDVRYSVNDGEINCSGLTSADKAYIVYGTFNNMGFAIYNSNKVSAGIGTYDTTGATTDAKIKLRSTYANWTDFDTYWIINNSVNSGYPMLKSFADMSAIMEFDGEGTEASPYQIKNQLDFINFKKYNNDRENRTVDFYWQLMDNIDLSADANGSLIHHTPVGKTSAFDGYFDGNGKTISGLLIDNQYEYTGLFGTIASNHWVKDLTVKGDIYWDEAYAVGGVAGRVLAGGYLQNCHFEGNIIGVLNTKTSTETNGVVGKFEINGAIDCTATYIDIKYAKIGGTSEAPTYTYYLYDWAQIKTYLYDKAVA